VFGNVLVVLGVYRERSLQSATNFFIVSLAIADIMVAILVMPLSIVKTALGMFALQSDLVVYLWALLSKAQKEKKNVRSRLLLRYKSKDYSQNCV